MAEKKYSEEQLRGTVRRAKILAALNMKATDLELDVLGQNTLRICKLYEDDTILAEIVIKSEGYFCQLRSTGRVRIMGIRKSLQKIGLDLLGSSKLNMFEILPLAIIEIHKAEMKKAGKRKRK